MNVLKFPHRFVNSVPLVKAATQVLSKVAAVALDIEALCINTDQKHLGSISLLQFCAKEEPVVFIVDVHTLGVPTVVEHLAPILTDSRVRKYMFDCRRDVEALSSQMEIKPAGVLDLQLFHTALQWKSKGLTRRSGLSYVLKNVLNLDRQEGDAAVMAAMNLGNRPVWDIRPLPDHFLEYAADDVRHVLLLAGRLMENYPDKVDAIERLTALYVDYYAVGRPVEVEADPAAHQVTVDWLERMLGPAGTCAFCGLRGHTEAECFKKKGAGTMKCSHCGAIGHLATACFKKHPQLMKCSHCGQLGHTVNRCFAKNPCVHCGGQHSSANCHSKPLVNPSS